GVDGRGDLGNVVGQRRRGLGFRRDRLRLCARQRRQCDGDENETAENGTHHRCFAPTPFGRGRTPCAPTASLSAPAAYQTRSCDRSRFKFSSATARRASASEVSDEATSSEVASWAR